MQTQLFFRVIATAIVSSTLSAAPFVFAQESLEEIVVTAERRVADLQQTPLSIVAFTSERLDELNIQDPQSLADFTPNVSIGDGTGRGAGGTSVSIRGVNEARISPVLDPAVGIYIDDVYYGRPQIGFLRLLDVERVEVLRGPQGTLFGKNSVGGAVRYITKKPDFDSVNGYAKVTFGEYNRADLKAAVNIPMGDAFALRLTGAALTRDGYVERLADGVKLGDEDTKFGMAQLRFSPNDSFDMNLRVDYAKRQTDDGPTKLLDYYRFNNTTDVTAGGPTAASPGSGATAAWNGYWGSTATAYGPSVPADLYKVDGSGRMSKMDSESIGAGLDMTWAISDSFSIRSITGYRTVDESTVRDPDDQANAWSFFDDIAEEGVDFWSQEFQLNGVNFSERLNWVGGVFLSNEEPYRREIEDRDARVHLRRGMLIRNDSSLQETRSLGIYLQGTYDFTEKLGVTLGTRYTEDDKNYTISQVALWDNALAAQAAADGLAPLAPPTFNGCDPSVEPSCVSVAPLSGGEKFDAWTPRLAIQYQFTDDIMAYVSASKGFKSGGTNDSVADIDTPFAPEEILTYEVGLRTQFADNRGRINATIYSSDYTDKQITVTTSPNCVNRCTTNVGEASIDGFELEAVGLVTDNLQLNASVGTINAEWTNIVNPSAGVTKASNFGRAPELSWTAGVRYANEIGGGSIVATADYAYTGDQNSSPQDSTTIFIPSYSLLNMRIAYTPESGNWNLGLFCANCVDEAYWTGGAAWAGAADNTPFPAVKPSSSYIYTQNGANPNGIAPPGITLINIGAPRMWGMDFQYNFGQ